MGHAEQAEKARKIPEHIYRELVGRGFFRILLPRRYGGFEFEPAVAARVVMELAAGCGSTGWVTSCAMSHQWMVAQFPLACHEEVWRDRPDQLVVTSFSPAGECVRRDGGSASAAPGATPRAATMPTKRCSATLPPAR